MDFVEFAYRDSYGDSAWVYVAKVGGALNEVYAKYKRCMDNSYYCGLELLMERLIVQTTVQKNLYKEAHSSRDREKNI